ncbi:MAG TPA: amino acid permease [Longilinea sp.]|nr:amino acid permease [Longilinea sp.]
MSEITKNPAMSDAPIENQAVIRLQRNLSQLNIAALAVAGCLAMAELLPLGIGIGLWPSADLGQGLAIAIGFNLLLVLLYALIGTVVPRSGADYIFTSRVLPAPLAFAGSFALLIAVVVAIGALAVLVAQAALTPFILYTASLLNNTSLASYGHAIMQPQGAITTGTVLVLIAFLFSILPPKIHSRILWVCLALGLVGWLAVFIQLATADPANFPAQWNLVMGEDSFAGQVTAARALSLIFGGTPGALFLAGIPLGFLVFSGARSPVLTSGEVKGKPFNVQFIGGLLAILGCGGLALVSVFLVNRALPLDWLAAESHLFLYNNQLETPALPWLPFYAVLLRPIYALFVLSTLGIIAALIAALQGFLRSFGRLVSAWADDHMMPDFVRSVHARFQAPLFAILFVSVLAEIGVSVAASYGVMKTVNATVFALVFLQVFPALAAVFFPLVRRRWNKNGVTPVKVGQTILLGISGLLSLVYLGWMIMMTFVYPAEGSPIGMIDILVLGSGLVFGLIWFTWRAVALRREGISIFKFYRSIPEE